ncbi:chemotaxis protein CheA [Geomonas sp. Red32]|uniref:chemotaxis protein CheA n=1 Tax=Geomonas sp. Red32 TaxID=2912856 RepID=UPI00202CC93F|nr:chemotaxis protein CheA [Geomonas sp. Red32]MCM0081305.1 chemotaxis protein CheA [Geomonas sp. Red32]
MSQYRNLFLSEAREYLKNIGNQVVALEESPSDRASIDGLFRAAHSLKGMAASMEYQDVVEVAHGMEDLMIKVRDGGLPFDAGIADLLLEGTDLIDGLLNDVAADLVPRRMVGDFPARVRSYQPGGAAPPQAPEGEAPGAPPSPAGQPAAAETAAAPEPPGPLATPSAAPLAAPPAAPLAEREQAGELITVRVRTELLDHLINLTGELITNKHRLLNIGRELGSPELDDAISENGKLLRSLHDEVMKVRLMPFEIICDRFQRSVRSLAKGVGKELHFELEGREIGLDRGILEQLIDPLNHILRNAVDHGLEGSQERLAAGKTAKGLVKLAVSRDRDRVLITVSDDGRGMDPQRMIEAALAKGVITQDEAERLSPRQALMLSCIPGFSTAREVTEVSGRGVGMDAVNASVQKMGGTLIIESEPGKGSSFTLRLPMTIAIIHALIVQCGPLKVGVPVTSVHRTVELRRDQVETIGKRQIFYLDEEPVQLLSLNRVLGLPLGRFPTGIVPLFVTEAKGRRVGIVVDRMHGQHELYVKPLGRPLSKLVGLAGGAILGDGELVTILDLADLL